MKNLRKNSKKGFTLVEIIVVVVIIAILAAALIPAVMNAVGQAQQTAADAEAKNLMTAGSMAALRLKATPDTAAEILAEIPGGSVDSTAWTVFFDGWTAVGATCTYNGKTGTSGASTGTAVNNND